MDTTNDYSLLGQIAGELNRLGSMVSSTRVPITQEIQANLVVRRSCRDFGFALGNGKYKVSASHIAGEDSDKESLEPGRRAYIFEGDGGRRLEVKVRGSHPWVIVPQPFDPYIRANIKDSGSDAEVALYIQEKKSR